MQWQACTIAVVGGDRREQEIARQAALTGARVQGYGFPWPEAGIQGVVHAESAAAALSGAHVALFPIPGIAPDGALFAPALTERIIPTPDMLASMREPRAIILGWADAHLKLAAQGLGVEFHEYEWDKDLMLLRGPAIVEGMLRVIIENTDFTIHQAQVGVVGQGTIGFLVTRTLIALGAHVSVFARNKVQRAEAYAAGAQSHPLEALEQQASGLDILISSVPHQLVGAGVLGRLPAHALLVDLAAPPGGIDREAAKERGLRFVWARGMGSRAPVTVGRSQWSGIRPRIETILGIAPESASLKG